MFGKEAVYMGSDPKKFRRRTFLSGASTVMFSVGGTGIINKTNSLSQHIVNKRGARRAAEAQLRRIKSSQHAGLPEWRDAEVGEAMTFHSAYGKKEQHYNPSAHVFTIKNSDKSVGYVTTSANKKMPPVIEFSDASPPSKKVNKFQSLAKSRGLSPTGRTLYNGGLAYNIELESGRGLNLQRGTTSELNQNFDPIEMKINNNLSEQKWSGYLESGGGR